MILKILFWSVGTPLLMVLVGVAWLAVRFSWWGLFVMFLLKWTPLSRQFQREFKFFF